MKHYLSKLLLMLPMLVVCSTSAPAADFQQSLQPITGTLRWSAQPDRRSDPAPCSLAKTIPNPGCRMDFFEAKYAVVTYFDSVYDKLIEHDHDLYFRCTACLDSTDWFLQQEGTVYWLGINAVTGNTDWGVRSSVSHWNANAVWLENQEEKWYELYVPPDFTRPLSMSFVVNDGTTGEYIVELGDSDASGGLDIDDAVWLIAYIFSSGPTPMPYPIASGDANCDCVVDIDDSVYLIAYIFSGGPPPCTGEEWISICGPPFR